MKQDPGGKSEILRHPPNEQQNNSASPQPKFCSSLLHCLNPP